MNDQDKIEIIQQLWNCLREGYTYNEAQIHMKAFQEGKTTAKKLVIVDKEKE
jgi:hypothetical protein